MRTPSPATLAIIDDRVTKLTTEVAMSLRAQASRPDWTQPKPGQLRRHLERQLTQIIARTLTEDPKWPPANALQPTEQRTLSRVAAAYARQQTDAILPQLTPSNDSSNQVAASNQEAINKKITFNKKFLAALLAAYIALQDQQYQKKTRKKLKRLALLERRRAAEEMMVSRRIEQAPPAPDSVLIPKKTPAPQYDYELPQHLHALGLPLGAGHQEIKAAFEKIDAIFKEMQLKFKQNINPTREEQETYQQAAADHQLAKAAYTALMQVDNDRLVHLVEITATEIREFMQNLQPQMPNLMNQPATLQELQAAVLAANIQAELGSEPACSPIQLQKMQLTLEKLEHHHQAKPDQLIDMRQFLPAPTPAALSPLSQTLTPRGHR